MKFLVLGTQNTDISQTDKEYHDSKQCEHISSQKENPNLKFDSENHSHMEHLDMNVKILDSTSE